MARGAARTGDLSIHTDLTHEEPGADRAAAEALLRGSRLLRNVPGSVVTRLAAVARVIDAPRGVTLWHEGDVAHELALVVRGLLRVVRHLPDGSELTLGLFGPHEWVGVPAALEAGRYPADAVAVTEVRLLKLPVASVRIERAEPTLSDAVQQMLLQHSRTLHAKLDFVGAGSTSSCLAALLLHLAERFGEHGDDGVTSIHLSLSRAVLAELVSARVETVIRLLSRWQREGLVSSGPRGVELYDLTRLRALVDGAVTTP